jgi:hypothetical protein
VLETLQLLEQHPKRLEIRLPIKHLKTLESENEQQLLQLLVLPPATAPISSSVSGRMPSLFWSGSPHQLPSCFPCHSQPGGMPDPVARETIAMRQGATPGKPVVGRMKFSCGEKTRERINRAKASGSSPQTARSLPLQSSIAQFGVQDNGPRDGKGVYLVVKQTVFPGLLRPETADVFCVIPNCFLASDRALLPLG